MLTFIFILIITACVLLTLVVLIQNPKGGGIAANFVAPNQIMGVKRSTDVVEKATWILAVVLISLSLLSNFFRSNEEGANVQQSRVKDAIESATIPTATQAPTAGASSQQNTQQNQGATNANGQQQK